MSSAAKNDATAQDPATARAVPERTPANGPPARTTGLKLRDCCQSCARSKVRCTKEKPSCSRCETKGIPCRYLHSKKPGRIPGSAGGERRVNPAARTTCEGPTKRAGAPTRTPSLKGPPPRGHSGAAHNHTSGATDDCAATTTLSPTSTTLDVVAPEDSQFRADSLFEAYYGAADAQGANLSPDLTFDGDNNASFMWMDCLDVLATMDDPTYADLMDWDRPGSALTAHIPTHLGGCDGVSLCGSVAQSPTSRLLPIASHVPSTSSVPTETGSQASSSTVPSSSSSALQVSSSSRPASLSTRTTPPAPAFIGRPQLKSTQSAPVPDQNIEPDTSSSCSCLDKALDLLKEVNKNPCPHPSETGGAITQAILAKNKEIIQDTLAILACVACMEDRLLIMISLLITMKMLPRYASAAALTGSATSLSDGATDMARHDHASLSNNALPVTGQNAPRQAKQQVLRELHLVQRLITQLSSRLKGLASPSRHSTSASGLLERRPAPKQTENSASAQKTRMRSNSLQSACGETQLMPISTRTLDLVEGDVRSSLSSLSAVVRNALKES
ncbi:hypothetical protein EK21DRAFT_78448 [Setomelanomma holmii]|uniref:Zn(2)-C6 fungal-type domain-containing protein n=1 Tax=Setomelanomma holmii TaxID=210430 RepID=A0A9P4GXL9_9PLEO|nr:hypothetical protein EK21DRAFT_78448 [Setomelanomma holmii]